MSYYRYVDGEQIKGPFDLQTLRDMISKGTLPLTAKASRNDGEWREVSTYREIVGPDMDLRPEGLTEYYKEEFQRIYESGETYKGKWNWVAFFFGPIWALLAGAWVVAVAIIVLTIVTYGIGGVICWFLLGARGNWLYYNIHVKGVQMPVLGLLGK